MDKNIGIVNLIIDFDFVVNLHIHYFIIIFFQILSNSHPSFFIVISLLMYHMF